MRIFEIGEQIGTPVAGASTPSATAKPALGTTTGQPINPVQAQQEKRSEEQRLQQAVKDAQAALSQAQKALSDFRSKP